MTPNLFMAYAFDTSEIRGLILRVLQLTHMAGWENGADPSSFIALHEALGLRESTNGASVVSVSYQRIARLDLQLWGFHFDDYADAGYAQASYELDLCRRLSCSMALQYDTARETGAKLAGKVHSNTWGASMEVSAQVGYRFYGAYNQDSGSTGAFPSLGAGPFYTSMEVQTLDAMGQRGKAYVFGFNLPLSSLGLECAAIGGAYGNFQAHDENSHRSSEFDIVVRGDFDERISLTLALATVQDQVLSEARDGNLSQFRMIVDMRF